MEYVLVHATLISEIAPPKILHPIFQSSSQADRAARMQECTMNGALIREWTLWEGHVVSLTLALLFHEKHFH